MVYVYSELEYSFILYFCLQFFLYFQIWNKKKSPPYRRFSHGNLTEPFKYKRKESFQPQVPLRLPCYDFAPVTKQPLVKYLET